MEEHAVLDRIVDDHQAVLLVGETEREHIVPLSVLPPDTRSGTWLTVEFEGDRLITAVIDEERTQQILERVKRKLAQLRKRSRRSHQ